MIHVRNTYVSFQITSITREQVKATLSQHQKFCKALSMAHEICSLASEVSMSEFKEHLHLLSQVRDAWAAGKNVIVQGTLTANTGL